MPLRAQLPLRETALIQTPRSGTKPPNHLVVGESVESSVPFLSYGVAQISVRIGWEGGLPFDPDMHVGKPPPRLGRPSRVGHDQVTAFICEVESFIARFKGTAQATFAKRVTIVFVGLRLGESPGHCSSFSSSSSFCQNKRHSPVSENMYSHADT